VAKTLTNIQKGARFNARSNELVITNGYGLAAFNSIYRKVCKALPWPELRVTHDATTSVSGTSQYTWVTAAVYMDVVSVEFGSTSVDAEMNLLISPPSEGEWNEAAKDSAGIPVYYQRYRSGSDNKLEVRPTPNYSGATIRATGTIQPTELTGVSGTTVFLMSIADDALEHMIAAEFLVRAGKLEDAQFNLQEATRILRDIFDEELVPTELTSNIIGMREQKGGGGVG